ncbi:flippase [Bacillus sp. 522_BSPC]|uniref:flippase n=1 Tax=Bacillus sp. 522_BSPC TaxID=1579338 RepID=UPI00065F95D2|nr:flippase [Bacillus sp. 522_BSPC]
MELLKKKHKKLVENFFSLSLVQATNMLLPLISLPYLVRVLGPDKYGLIIFSQMFIQYFVLFTDYGFNLSATKEIAKSNEDKDEISNIFNSVQLIKGIFLILSFIIVIMIISNIQKFSEDKMLFLISFGLVLSNVLFPIWFFMGIEKMKYITFLNLLSKIFYTIGIFIFVKSKNDYLWVPILNVVGQSIVGLISLYIIFFKYKVKLRFPGYSSLIYHLKEGWFIFLSTISVSIYTISNTFILGLFTSTTIVGYYSAAEKLINTVNNLITPIGQSIFPHVNKLFSESKIKGLRFLKKVLILVTCLSLVFSFTIFNFSSTIINIFYGEEYKSSIEILKILSFVPFLVAISNIFGTQTMLPLGFHKQFSSIIVIGSLVNILLAFTLVPKYTYFGTGFGALFSELLVALFMMMYLKYKGISYFNKADSEIRNC